MLVEQFGFVYQTTSCRLRSATSISTCAAGQLLLLCALRALLYGASGSTLLLETSVVPPSAAWRGNLGLLHSRRSNWRNPALRQLVQTGQLNVPRCLWNDVEGACSPSQLSYLSLKSRPVTIFHRTAVMAYSRNLICSAYVNETKCNKDQANRCMYWKRSCIGVDAYELTEWISGMKLDGQATTAAFTCSGTDAQAYRVCHTAADAGLKGICDELPGCHYVSVTNDCMPIIFDMRNFQTVQQVVKGFTDLDPTVWGSCAGACYVRQAAECYKHYNISKACASRPYCPWDLSSSDGRDVCMHKDTASRGTDAFSKEFAALKATCQKAQTQSACERLRVAPKPGGNQRETVFNMVTEEKSREQQCPL